MNGVNNRDLSSIARLARKDDGDLKPLLLRVQTEAFVTAARRDRQTVHTFATLALGLAPHVDHETAALVLARLAECPETPERVLDALRVTLGEAADDPLLTEAVRQAAEPNLGPSAIQALAVLDGTAIDLALARNAALTLDGHALSTLVERARGAPLLAAALLSRDEPSLLHRATLYRFCTRPQRDAIREAIADTMPAVTAYRTGNDDLRDRLSGLSDSRASGKVIASFAARMGGTDGPWRLDREPEQELIALALVAVGLPPDDCIRLFLTADAALAQSVESVFRLAEIMRTTPRGAAAQIVGCASDAFEIALPPARDGAEPWAERPARGTKGDRRSLRAVAASGEVQKRSA